MPWPSWEQAAWAVVVLGFVAVLARASDRPRVRALGAFAQRCNIHGGSMKAHARAIRRRLAEEAEEAVESVADAPPVLTVQSPPAVVVPVASPPAAPNGLASVPPAARIGTVIEWLTAIRAMRDELREHGVLVEGTVSITVDL